MASFRYRAATAAGTIRKDVIEADSQADAIQKLRDQGLRPIEAVAAATPRGGKKAKAALPPAALAKTLGELAVLTGAGLPLDRSLVVTIENIEHDGLKDVFQNLQRRVKEGTPLSTAIAESGGAFPAMVAPMIEAGEASGQLAAALDKLAEALTRAEKLRQTFVSAMIYPIILTIIAVSVVLMMLLFVVPQFDSLFASSGDKLPAMTKLVLGASMGLRQYGLVMLGAAAVLVVGIRQWLAQPAVRAMVDRRILTVPRVGELVRRMETARFSRVMGSLVTGNVALPTALSLAQRTIGNAVMAAEVARIGTRVKEGALLSQEFASSGLFPRTAISFIRTGEETARLGPMLEKLSDVLDEDISVQLVRLTGLLTPLITIVMGVVIATVIGSIMTAILGFNSLALE